MYLTLHALNSAKVWLDDVKPFMINYVPQKITNVIIYPCPILRQMIMIKEALGASNLAAERNPETGVERESVKQYIATGGYTSRLIYLQVCNVFCY